jgi:hypothetical protein
MSSVQVEGVREVARKASNRKGQAFNAAFVQRFKNQHALSVALISASNHSRYGHSARTDARGLPVLTLRGGNTHASNAPRVAQVGTMDLPHFLREFDHRRAPITKKDRERWALKK